ncbi:MAG: four helix bundle protein [Candidatus Koribacter versatilis]|uniref:Four helix bundle protein n=1 Tax=Candidatus Korobacter versatilis TaxID=658062 RepID=A0A932AA52_9BACT|nr:four helix bundle protein [Candidatus Koribacter versatilis]
MKDGAAPGKIKSYEDLIAWQKAMDFAEEIYKVTKSFPDTERYGLVSQLRRAAVSIPSNLAEGQGRSSTGEFKLFIGHARGSLYEVQTQLRLASRFKYIPASDCERLLRLSYEIGRIMHGLLGALD